MDEKWTRVVIHDSHGNVIADRPLSPEGATEQVSEHNADQEAHPQIQEAITGLRTQVERRLVGAKVTFNDGHTEEVELGQNDQGEVILLLPKETFGKIDGVSVNGEELEVDENGKVDINFSATVDGTYSDTPTVTPTIGEDGIQLDFQGIRGNGIASSTEALSDEDGGVNTHKFIDNEGNEHVFHTKNGKQGRPGADRQPVEAGDVIIAHTTGQDEGKVMSQKAVTEEFTDINMVIGGFSETALPINVTWAQGSINEQGSDLTANTSIRTNFITSANRIRIACAEGYFIKIIYAYNSSSTSDGIGYVYFGNQDGTGYDIEKTSMIILGLGKYYRVVVGKVDGSNIATSDGGNVSLSDVRKIGSGLKDSIVEEIAGIKDDVSMTEETPIAEQYGWVSSIDGELTPSSAATNFLRKYAIDSSKKYYADIRLFPNSSSSNIAGVAYFDEDEKFICSQYNTDFTNVAKTYSKAELNIPPHAAFVYVLGTDETASYANRFECKLYSACLIAQDCISRIGEKIPQEVQTCTAVGNGDTSVVMGDINISPNSLYVVKAECDSWTMPDPTSESTGFGFFQIVQRPSGTASDMRVISQKDFSNDRELWFIGNMKSNTGHITLRAAEGEVIKLTIYELLNPKKSLESLPLQGNPKPAVMYYNTVRVSNSVLDDNVESDTKIAMSETESSWAVYFPPSYKANGAPTRLIAMLHGASAYVSPTVMGYTAQKWTDWRNAYLANGFAVMDINGWGISASGSDNKSRHWGCPLAVETLDKAFEMLKSRYNISDKLLIHGSSMGGAAAWSYALTHPNKVLAVGLFSPGTISWIMLKDRNTTGDDYTKAAVSWQYNDVAEAVEDDFSRIVGYDPIIRSLRYHNGLYEPITQLAGHDVLQYANPLSEYTLVGQSLQYPVRIWHGDLDPTVPIELSKIISTAYRRGGQNVSLRVCPNETHAICTGGTQYVVDESIDYFKMYK